jgi:hypothetical protein
VLPVKGYEDLKSYEEWLLVVDDETLLQHHASASVTDIYKYQVSGEEIKRRGLR